MPRRKQTTLTLTSASDDQAGSTRTMHSKGSEKDPYNSPAMQQYKKFKDRHPDCILLFRMGDFYELFGDDAIVASKAIGLTLTKRQNGIPMAGAPHHQLDTYLRKLIDQGFRVAVCDQLEDPKQAKGIVARGVTRVLTPGTLVDETLVADETPIRLASIAMDGNEAALAIVETSTGELLIAETTLDSFRDELVRLGVRELLFAAGTGNDEPSQQLARTCDAIDCALTPRAGWEFRSEEADEAIKSQFGVSSLAGFGMQTGSLATSACGALIRYLKQTQTGLDVAHSDGTHSRNTSNRSLSHLQAPRHITRSDRLVLDAVSLRALEIDRTIRTGQIDGSLVGVFLGPGKSGCETPMGKRLLAEWLRSPLRDLDAINTRQSCVATLVSDTRLASELRDQLDGIGDIARIAGRLALGRATPRDLVALGTSLSRIASLGSSLENAQSFVELRASLINVAQALIPLADEITSTCVDEPPVHLRDGGLIRDGIDAELDEARSLQRDAGAWLAQYQQKLISEFDLSTLKVGYNKIFGYYIELTSTQAKDAPPIFSRKQTLKNAERFITPELHEFEQRVATADARALQREQDLFDQLCTRACAHLDAMSTCASTIAAIDAIGCFAAVARKRGWTRPEICEKRTIDITQGRHPVLDELLEDRFVPNNTQLCAARNDESAALLALITGPNMGGKSTYIRQTALLVLLAHAGSFVPAERARIGLCDRIFTRVGADDALHEGQSTFMVEMAETAAILTQATDRSLVVLDEIGRGTSTLDGLSLAWSIVEYLARDSGPLTLFATHYHELTELEHTLRQHVRNLHVTVREWQGEIVFLHEIKPGCAGRSYGLHVAKLAGVPKDVVERARVMLDTLESQHAVTQLTAETGSAPTRKGSVQGTSHARTSQPSLFESAAPHPAVDRLREVKLDSLSPLAAFDTLRELLDLIKRS
ncbi:MAG: DNA mismatch repair protein MutS [Phycisphaeraceae bacterium]|nr:DNA mismatch repair protein MutS [Phycisphaerales bacterium]MCB9858973.1 DNA mismatch repair protein MutS [Phycisphaeraceae bacterium]